MPDRSAQLPTFSTMAVGERAGSTSAVQLPTVACRLARIKAVASNTGKVYIGIAGVTKVNGTTDTTTGWELRASEETPWLPIDNLDKLYMICDAAGDDIVYFLMVS